MSIQTLSAQVLSLLAPLVLAALSAAVGWLFRYIAGHVRNARLAKALEAASALVAAGVADAMQRVVLAAKRDGQWSPAIALDVKRAVVSDAKSLAPALMNELASAGVTNVDVLLGRLVEASVLALKARAPDSLPTWRPDDDPTTRRTPVEIPRPPKVPTRMGP